MKRTDTELEELLNRLIASTRSPRGRFSAAESYGQLEKRLPQRNGRLRIMRIVATVAAISLFCIMGWLAYDYARPDTLQTVSTLADVRTIELPDGTRVTLNHFSSLTYPERFRQKNREVDLSGEAYFEVARNTEHPFLVQTESVNVQVLGTHFNVEAYLGDPEVKTTLLEGSVEVSNKSRTACIVLRPNESAIYNREKKSLTLEASNHAPEEIAWRSGTFIFTNLPLQEIARQLSHSFGVNIRIEGDSLPNYRLNARFTDGESLERILHLLHLAGHFEYTKSNNEILITNK